MIFNRQWYELALDWYYLIIKIGLFFDISDPDRFTFLVVWLIIFKFRFHFPIPL